MTLSLPSVYYTWHVKYFTYLLTYLLMQVRANLTVLVLGFTVLDIVLSLTVLVLFLALTVMLTSLPLIENGEQ